MKLGYNHTKRSGRFFTRACPATVKGDSPGKNVVDRKTSWTSKRVKEKLITESRCAEFTRRSTTTTVYQFVIYLTKPNNMQSKSSAVEKECFTPTRNGGGDGLLKKRLPLLTSSARKINPSTPRNEKSLHKTLSERKPLKKSASVAEITPTKSKKRPLVSTADSSIEIFATPRPMASEKMKLKCSQELNSCKLYRRLMLLAWRRSRKGLKDLEIACKDHKSQIVQLEMQVDVLNKLRERECEKREEAQTENLSLKKHIEYLDFENTQLNEDLDNLQMSFDMSQNDLKICKAENNVLSDQSMNMQSTIEKIIAENKHLEDKIQHHENTIINRQLLFNEMEGKLVNLEKNLRLAQLNYKIKEKKYTQLKCEFKKQLDQNKLISDELGSLKNEKLDISLKVEDLEKQLNDYIRSCEVLNVVNNELTMEVHDITVELEEEKKFNWMRNAQRLKAVSLKSLQWFAQTGVIENYLKAPFF